MKFANILFIFFFTINLHAQIGGYQSAPRPAAQASFLTEKSTDIFAVLAGKWDLKEVAKPCRENPFTISFADSNRQLLLTYENLKNDEGKAKRETYVYNLTMFGRSGVRGQIENETRLQPNGDPIIWDFVVLSKDEFCWRSTTWATDACTKPLVRCP